MVDEGPDATLGRANEFCRRFRLPAHVSQGRLPTQKTFTRTSAEAGEGLVKVLPEKRLRGRRQVTDVIA